MSQLNTFLCKKRFIPFMKEPIFDHDKNILMQVSTKISWNPTFKFHVGGVTKFSAILKNAPGNPLKKQFFIFDNSSDKSLAVVSEKSLHKKESLFTEYDILISDNNYKAVYKPMYKGFKIVDEKDQLCVSGVKTDFIKSNFLNNRSYYVEICNQEHNYLIWLAVVKGMQVLE